MRGPPKENDEFIYFIRSGRCRVVKDMNLVTRSLPFKLPRLILPSQKACKDFRLTKFDTMKKYFLVIHVLEKGDYFGVGEDRLNTSIITVAKVRLIGTDY